MEKIKQNKNTSAVIRVASATLAAVIIMCTFTIPSFATSNNYVGFTEYNCSDYSTNTGAFKIGYSNNDTSAYTYLKFVDGDKFYPCGYEFSTSSYNWVIFVNEKSHGKISAFTAGNPENFTSSGTFSNGIESYAITTSGNPLANTGIGAYTNSSSRRVGGFAENIPIFTSYDEACQAFSEYLNQSSGTTAEFNYSIKPGYALFIDIHGLSEVSGTLFTNTSAAYASPHTSNQTLSYQSSLPSGNVSPQGNGINWQGIGNKDLFGRYKSWNRSLIIQPNSHYIAIYNPVHINTYVDPEHEDFNGNISVHVNKAYSETSILIPLNTELTGTGTVGTNTTDEQKPVVYDENTNSWIPQNSDGTPYTESPYGDYMPSTVNSIHDWLQNIANLISGFFNGAIGAVTTLVGAGSAFINQLVSLYSWLPAPVYAVLSSALILVITIGVIKVFI